LTGPIPLTSMSISLIKRLAQARLHRAGAVTPKSYPKGRFHFNFCILHTLEANAA
jgi:hypothetical protein